jgi:hypothetical protein
LLPASPLPAATLVLTHVSPVAAQAPARRCWPRRWRARPESPSSPLVGPHCSCCQAPLPPCCLLALRSAHYTGPLPCCQRLAPLWAPLFCPMPCHADRPVAPPSELLTPSLNPQPRARWCTPPSRPHAPSNTHTHTPAPQHPLTLFRPVLPPPAAGTEFMEMFVGVGASRVRDIFRQARENVSRSIFVCHAAARCRPADASGVAPAQRPPPRCRPGWPPLEAPPPSAICLPGGRCRQPRLLERLVSPFSPLLLFFVCLLRLSFLPSFLPPRPPASSSSTSLTASARPAPTAAAATTKTCTPSTSC